MTSSGEEYVISRRKKIERRQRLVTVVSIISFLCSGAVSVVSSVKQGSQNSKPVTVSAESALQQQVRGFELVLQREPDNQVALEGLVMARIQMKDVQGAIPPLEKLVKLHPERQDYKQMLQQVKKQVGKGS
ncbi:MAG: tetratricopeptide repeat protein [Stigonema ocellatum SAG 48.90 = DSM 106950]|nr:tetratricopeptide repeat protein [Stigonema ocellatum SAG 48.90 = DSM 106950]